MPCLALIWFIPSGKKKRLLDIKIFMYLDTFNENLKVTTININYYDYYYCNWSKLPLIIYLFNMIVEC